ncbi:MAG: MASE1 domain-containing protein [Rudaea sp.]
MPLSLASAIARLGCRFPSAALRPLALLAFALVYWLLLTKIARFYWFVPCGLRVACLALLPLRWWRWIIAGEFLARTGYAAHWIAPHSLSDFLTQVVDSHNLAVIFLAPLLALPGSWYLRRWVPNLAQLRQPRVMGYVLLACLLSAAGDSLGNILTVMYIPRQYLPMGAAQFIVGKIVGDYIGVIAVAPAAFALLLPTARPVNWRNWLPDAILLFAFGAVYVALMRLESNIAIYEYSRVLVLFPVFIVAFRRGWRGGAIALAFCSTLVALVPALHPADAYRDLLTQMLLAIAGTAGLLLGSAIDATRNVQTELALQNVALASANTGLDHLGAELRDAAQRNLRMEEEQRRRIAAEIHDELGQNLTAVHTRVKLAADRLNAAQLGDVTASIYEILATMRGSVRGLMDSLRPPVLDEFGLVRALREGPLRDLVERAGLRYAFDLRGDPALIAALDEATQIAIWRIVQEAATNTVRHAHATCFRARLHVGVRGANALAILDLRDDGIGIADATTASRGGHGLQGMRDRALALNGVMRVAANRMDTRLRVLLRQAL